MAATSMAPAEAVKLFARSAIKVQTATPITVKDKDTGKERQVFKTDVVPLAADHVLDAKRAADGTVTIVTIDGRKFSAQAKGE